MERSSASNAEVVKVETEKQCYQTELHTQVRQAMVWTTVSVQEKERLQSSIQSNEGVELRGMSQRARWFKGTFFHSDADLS